MSVEGVAAAEVAEFAVAATALLRAASVIGVLLPVCSGISGEESATVVVSGKVGSSQQFRKWGRGGKVLHAHAIQDKCRGGPFSEP